MTCHSCPHAEDILHGEYDSKPWNELPCASCKLGEDTFFSVPFDEEHPPAGAVIPSYGGVPEGRDGSPHLPSGLCPPTSGSPLLPADVLSQFVQGFLNLPPELRDIVAWRYQGLPYKEIARLQGTTTQCAEMRHKRALREWPVLQSLFPLKTAKRKRRRGSP
jgi:hypothetical protein